MRTLLLDLYLLLAVVGVHGRSETQERHSWFPARSLGNGVPLRILPLGASITVGTDSTGLNGYRDKLRILLEKDGNNVTYVGTRHVGTMRNNAVQAIPGQTIEQVDATALKTNVFNYEPNIILINAGTNNCAKPGFTIPESSNAYAKLLKHINSSAPTALTVVSNLIPNLLPEINACVDQLNPELRRVAMEASDSGQKIAFVDMNSAVPKSVIDTHDSTHPVDEGYSIMARVWYEGLQRASVNITAATAPRDPLPVNTDSPNPLANKPMSTPSGGGASPTPSHSFAHRGARIPYFFKSATFIMHYL